MHSLIVKKKKLQINIDVIPSSNKRLIIILA